MGDQDNLGNTARDSDRPRPRFSPFSPFPYGSPLTKVNSLQTSFSGSPGQKMLLAASLNHSKPPGADREVMTPRLKSQDLYGGPVMFGSSARKSRLISASPYSAAFRTRAAERQARLDRGNLQTSIGAAPPSSLPSTAPSSPHSSPGPSSSPPAPLSSTARVILSTLEKLSSCGTPINDAKKIPLVSPSSTNRAEKRKLLESELNCSLSSSPSRRRARLGGGGLALALSGPPLRKNFSPSLNNSSSTVSNSSTSSTPVRPASSSKLTNSVERPAVAASKPPQPPSTGLFGSSTTVAPMVAVPTKSNDDINNANSYPMKSSFKMKSKVTEPTRSSSQATDLTCDPTPEHLTMVSGAQLKVDKLPVFNFSSATSATSPQVNHDKEKSNITKAVNPPLSPIPPEVLERNNNNKSPLKRQITDSEVSIDSSDNSKKLKCAEKCFPNNDSLLVTKSISKQVFKEDTVLKKYSFSTPTSVIDKSESDPVNVSVEASIKYSFSVPKSIRQQCENGQTNSSTIPPQNNFQFSTSVAPNSTFGTKISSLKTMPDITNNSLINDKVKGSSSTGGLPDVTASTGFGGFLPAKELKTGSVMDILGKKI